MLNFLNFLNCLLVLSVLVSLSPLPTYVRSCCRPVSELKEERKKKRCMCGKEIPPQSSKIQSNKVCSSPSSLNGTPSLSVAITDNTIICIEVLLIDCYCPSIHCRWISLLTADESLSCGVQNRLCSIKLLSTVKVWEMILMVSAQSW